MMIPLVFFDTECSVGFVLDVPDFHLEQFARIFGVGGKNRANSDYNGLGD